MVDLRNNLARQVEAEVRRHFGDRVFKTAIPRNVRLSEAPSHGKPVLLYDAHSKGALSYLQLANEILERLRRPEPPPPPPTLTPAGDSE
jgi:chromosome partitioning protein